MRITAPVSGTKAPWTECGSRIAPTCGARKAGSTCAPCAMRTRADCSDTPWVSSKAPTWLSPHSTWPLPPVAASPQGSCPTLIGEHSSPPRNWPPTCAPSKEPCRWDRPECAGITPWPNPFGPPSKPSTTTGAPSPPATRSTPGVATWIEDFYNRRRIHTSLGGTPHRIRTTPSGLDNSRINKPSTNCTQSQPEDVSSEARAPHAVSGNVEVSTT